VHKLYYKTIKKRHEAVVLEIKLSKENTTDKKADGVNRSHKLTTTFLPKRSGVNGFTLRDDAKLQNF
jgi:hypothetical protein